MIVPASIVKVVSVAQMGLLEMFHRKVFWALALVGAGLLLFSLFLANLSINEQFRVLSQVGSFSLQACGLIFSMALGGRIVPTEIERQSYQLDLSRPLSRGQWLLGKWIAGALLLIVYSVGLHLLFRLVLQLVLPPAFIADRYLVMAAFNIAELLLVFSFTLAMSLFTRPALAVAGGVALYLSSHWQPDLIFYAQKTDSVFFQYLYQVFQWILPPLHKMNFRSEAYLLGQEVSQVSSEQLAFLLVTSVLWCYLYFRGALFVLRRKDLV